MTLSSSASTSCKDKQECPSVDGWVRVFIHEHNPQSILLHAHRAQRMVSTIISICWCTVSSGGVGGYEHLPLQIKSQCAIHCRVSSPHDIVYTLSSRQGRETTVQSSPSFLPSSPPDIHTYRFRYRVHYSGTATTTDAMRCIFVPPQTTITIRRHKKCSYIRADRRDEMTWHDINEIHNHPGHYTILSCRESTSNGLRGSTKLTFVRRI